MNQHEHDKPFYIGLMSGTSLDGVDAVAADTLSVASAGTVGDGAELAGHNDVLELIGVFGKEQSGGMIVLVDGDNELLI
mgnify:CR=1 FL=1